MNCARYTTLCTVASIAYIATRPMHHVSHARALAASSLMSLRRTKPLSGEHQLPYVMLGCGRVDTSYQVVSDAVYCL